MATHVVSIDLRLLTNTFDRSLQGVESQINKVFGGLNNRIISQGSVATGLYTSLWSSAFNIITNIGTSAFRGIGEEIQRSINYQNDLISAANSYKSLLGLTFKDSTLLAQRANKEFLQSSVGLPFASYRETLRNIFADDFLSSFYDKNNTQGSIQRTAELLNKTSIIIGGITGVTNAQRANYLSGFIGGNNISQLRKLEVYRNAPQFSRVLDSEIKNIGGDQAFNSLDRQARIAFLEKVINQALPQETLDAYSRTLGAAFGKLNLVLFGDAGLFSFTRDLISFIPGSNIVNSLGNFFSELFKLDGVFGVISVGLAGVVDPLLLGIKGFFETLTLILRPINAVISKFQFLNPLIYGLSFALTTLATVGVARLTASTIRGILVQSGAGLLGGRLGSLALLGRAGAVTPGGLAGGVLASSLGFLPRTVTALTNLSRLGFASIATGFGLMARGVITFSTSLLPLLLNPAFLLFAGAVTAIGLAGYTVYKYWNPLKEIFAGFWEGFLENFAPLAGLMSVFQETLIGIGQALKPIVDGFSFLGTILAPVGNGITTFFNGQQVAGTPQNRDFGRSLGRGVGDFAKFIPGIPGVFSTILSGLSGIGNAPGVKSYAFGNSGLLGSLLQEVQNMPSNASLAIANSSEAILTQSQQKSLLNGLSSRPSLTIHNLNVSGNNARSLANDIVNSLNQTWAASGRGDVLG